jgi:hypothetical protein
MHCIANGVVYDVVHGFVIGVGLLYLQNCIRFYDAGVRVIPFTPIWRVQPFLC